MTACRFCATALGHVMVDLGVSPLCESYRTVDQLDEMEPFYPLRVHVCHKCFLVQVEEYVSPAEIFTEYAYFSALKAAQPCLENDEIFLANYADGLSDLNLRAYLDYFTEQDKVAAFACVRPHQSFHVVQFDDSGSLSGVRYAGESGLWINGGFFVFKRKVFDYINDGEDLVAEPFQRLIGDGQLAAYRHEGFWHCMDTFKDKQAFDDMSRRGATPWEIWHDGAKEGLES